MPTRAANSTPTNRWYGSVFLTAGASGSANHHSCYMHGCPCGYLGDPAHECRCSAHAIGRYQKRISGPLLDRIDIHLEVPRVEYEQLADKRAGEASSVVRVRVARAREIQTARYEGTTSVTNADIGPKALGEHVTLDATGEKLLQSAVKQMNLSARAYHRVLKLARTIADLDGEGPVSARHVAEAIQSTRYKLSRRRPPSPCTVVRPTTGRLTSLHPCAARSPNSRTSRTPVHVAAMMIRCPGPTGQLGDAPASTR